MVFEQLKSEQPSQLFHNSLSCIKVVLDPMAGIESGACPYWSVYPLRLVPKHHAKNAPMRLNPWLALSRVRFILVMSDLRM